MKARAWIALGANLEQPKEKLSEAVCALRKHFEVLKESSFYASAPHGVTDQPEFVNAVVSVQTELHPQEVLGILHQIEDEFGRVRTRHWGPRSLDLDLLGYENWKYSGWELNLPHPEILNGCFVLAPLEEIHPDWTKTYLDIDFKEAWKKLNASEVSELRKLKKQA